jgi:hypothetical protein
MRSSGGAPICVDARTVAQSATQFQGFVICRPVPASGNVCLRKRACALVAFYRAPTRGRFRNRSQTSSVLYASKKYRDHWNADHFFEYAEDLDPEQMN